MHLKFNLMMIKGSGALIYPLFARDALFTTDLRLLIQMQYNALGKNAHCIYEKVSKYANPLISVIAFDRNLYVNFPRFLIIQPL